MIYRLLPNKEKPIQTCQPRCKNEVCDAEIGKFAVLVADDVHQWDDNKHATNKFHKMQCCLWHTATVLDSGPLVIAEHPHRENLDNGNYVMHYGYWLQVIGYGRLTHFNSADNGKHGKSRNNWQYIICIKTRKFC